MLCLRHSPPRSPLKINHAVLGLGMGILILVSATDNSDVVHHRHYPRAPSNH